MTTEQKKPGRGRLVLQYIRKKFLQIFIEHKVFIGTYADNEIEIRKWAHGKSIMIIRVTREKLMYDSKQRLHHTALHKTQKHVVSFVADNEITRWLGWRPTPEHMRIMRAKGNAADAFLKLLENEPAQV